MKDKKNRRWFIHDFPLLNEYGIPLRYEIYCEASYPLSSKEEHRQYWSPDFQTNSTKQFFKTYSEANIKYNEI